jgi:hypothetical protein
LGSIVAFPFLSAAAGRAGLLGDQHREHFTPPLPMLITTGEVLLITTGEVLLITTGEVLLITSENVFPPSLSISRIDVGTNKIAT